jgi:hypothetical protein
LPTCICKLKKFVGIILWTPVFKGGGGEGRRKGGCDWKEENRKERKMMGKGKRGGRKDSEGALKAGAP